MKKGTVKQIQKLTHFEKVYFESIIKHNLGEQATRYSLGDAITMMIDDADYYYSGITDTVNTYNRKSCIRYLEALGLPVEVLDENEPRYNASINSQFESDMVQAYTTACRDEEQTDYTESLLYMLDCWIAESKADYFTYTKTDKNHKILACEWYEADSVLLGWTRKTIEHEFEGSIDYGVIGYWHDTKIDPYKVLDSRYCSCPDNDSVLALFKDYNETETLLRQIQSANCAQAQADIHHQNLTKRIFGAAYVSGDELGNVSPNTVIGFSGALNGLTTTGGRAA